MKRVISMVLCLMLVLGLAMGASAATHSVVNNTTDHEYQAYQIFKGTQTASDAALGQIEWGTGIGDAGGLLAELKALTIFANCATANDVSNSLVTGGAAAAADFANIAVKYLSDTFTPIAANAASVELEPGYYLLKDVTKLTAGTDGTLTDALNPALMQVTNYGAIQINKKYDTTEHEKHIISKDASGGTNHTSVTEASIGETVTFHLKATLPDNVMGYDSYRLVFHDKMSEGLTFGAVNSVTIDGNAAETNLYTVNGAVTSCSNGNSGCSLEVTFADIMKSQYFKAGAVVIVEYTATVNEKAKINEPNTNDSRVEFSNDPNSDGTGSTVPTGQTPWDHVEVYTTEVELLKRDGLTDHALQGAEFTITGDGVNVVVTTVNKFTAYTAEETAYANGKYWLLTDGSYTTTDPADLTDTSMYADTDTVYGNETVTTVKGNGQTDTKVSAYVGTDGRVKFSGLGVGTYTIEETVVPAGYNKMDNLTLKIDFSEKTKIFSYEWEQSGTAVGSRYEIEVDNNKGSTLPETGGMGTTLFYVIGGLMVAASVVLLVTKKRMIAE